MVCNYVIVLLSVLIHVLLLPFSVYYFREQTPTLTSCPNCRDHLSISPSLVP